MRISTESGDQYRKVEYSSLILSDRLCHYIRNVSIEWIFRFRASSKQNYGIRYLYYSLKDHDFFYQLQGAKIFLRINLQSGYHSEVSIQDLLWLLYILGYVFSELLMPSVQNWLLSVFLFMLSPIRVFLIFGILIYSRGNGKYVARLKILL